MRSARNNRYLATLVDEGAMLQQRHGRYEAVVFLLTHRVRWRLIVRLLGLRARRRKPQA